MSNGFLDIQTRSPKLSRKSEKAKFIFTKFLHDSPSMSSFLPSFHLYLAPASHQANLNVPINDKNTGSCCFPSPQFILESSARKPTSVTVVPSRFSMRIFAVVQRRSVRIMEHSCFKGKKSSSLEDQCDALKAYQLKKRCSGFLHSS